MKGKRFMKKFFTLLTALVLCSSVGWGAKKTLPRKVTQADFSLHWDYAGDSYMNTNGYGYLGQNNGNKVYRYQWDTDLQMYIVFQDNSATWTSPKSSVTVVVPAKGTYSVSTSLGDKVIGKRGAAWDGVGTQSRYVEDGTSYYFESGTFKVEEGEDGPYMYTTTAVNLKYKYGKNWNSVGTCDMTIGSAATYYNVTVNSNNTTMGTASYAYKSGYVYNPTTTSGTHFKKNSIYTLTATAKPGYIFVRWSDGVTDATRDITITGNATYTAEFASAASEATITLNAGTGGTVSGAGTFDTNTQRTITATPNANYGFARWEDTNTHATISTDASYTFNLVTDVNYTAIFYAPGTITANANDASMGTVTGGGQYKGGTEVTLTATANDGYVFSKWSDNVTDNPRTINVDGNATYTATFIEGVNINVTMGRLGVYDSNDGATMNDGTGNAWFHIIGKTADYEVRFESYGKSFSPGQTYGSSDVDQNYSWVKYKGSKISLDFSKVSARATLNKAYGAKYGIYDVNMTFYDTNGKLYFVTMQAVRAIYFDTADDYAFPKTNFNFNAPTYKESIPEDYHPGAWSYTADEDGKWLYVKQEIGGADYYVRLCFKVSGNSIPSGTYPIQANNEAIPVGSGIPVISYYTQEARWPQEVDGSNVFIWGDDAYWFFLQYGTIKVINTNGVYYVEVDAINSFAEPVKFTMGTKPIDNHTVTLTCDPVAGGTAKLYSDQTCQNVITPTSGSTYSIEDGTTVYAKAVANNGYKFDSWTVNDAGEEPTFDAPNRRNVTMDDPSSPLDAGDLTDNPQAIEVTSDLDITAYFTQLVKFTVKVTDPDGAALALGDITEFITIEPEGEKVTGENAWLFDPEAVISLTATTPFNGYDFKYWELDGDQFEDNPVEGISVAEYTAITAVYKQTPQPVDYTLLDNREDAYYTTVAALNNEGGYNFTLSRDFADDQWSTVCLPFDVDYATMMQSGMYGHIYKFNSATGNAKDGMTMNFDRATEMEAGVPYLFWSNSSRPETHVKNPVFNRRHVMDDYAAKEVGGEGIHMKGTLRQCALGQYEGNHRVMGLSKNKIYYVKSSVNMKAFRAYFLLLNAKTSGVTPRVRIVLDGETITELETVNADTEETTAQKYIDNGQLIILRDGKRHNAQGAVID